MKLELRSMGSTATTHTANKWDAGVNLGWEGKNSPEQEPAPAASEGVHEIAAQGRRGRK